MNIGQIASQLAVTVSVGATLEDAAAEMLSHGVGTLIVTKLWEGRASVAGILTDRDIVRARLQHTSALSALDVADAMTLDPLIIDADESIPNAIRHLKARSVRRAPVVTRDGTLLGVISTDDLIREIAEQLGALAQLVARQGSQGS